MNTLAESFQRQHPWLRVVVKGSKMSVYNYVSPFGDPDPICRTLDHNIVDLVQRLHEFLKAHDVRTRIQKPGNVLVLVDTYTDCRENCCENVFAHAYRLGSKQQLKHLLCKRCKKYV